MESELLELFNSVKKAADAASSSDGVADEKRCLDALEELKKFPVNYQILVSTQVGKSLRHLTKHPRKKIQSFASDLIEIWKRIIFEETSKTKSGNSDIKAQSPNAEKLRKTPPVKVESTTKAEPVKVEKIERNGTSSSEKVRKVQNVDVKTQQNGYRENVKVENAMKAEKTFQETVPVQRVMKDERKVNRCGPPKLTSMPRTNDSLRDKVRDIIHEALARVSGEADEHMRDEVDASDPIRVTVNVESALFHRWGHNNGAHKMKYRSLLFNLKDSKNPDFRRKVLLGQVEPERLLLMSTAEMASEQRKRENEQIKEKFMFDCERGMQPKETTDQFKCGRCGQRKTTYYQMQTRSADEPMTTYVTCVNCNNHWKFC